MRFRQKTANRTSLIFISIHCSFTSQSISAHCTHTLSMYCLPPIAHRIQSTALYLPLQYHCKGLLKTINSTGIMEQQPRQPPQLQEQHDIDQPQEPAAALTTAAISEGFGKYLNHHLLSFVFANVCRSGLSMLTFLCQGQIYVATEWHCCTLASRLALLWLY